MEVITIVLYLMQTRMVLITITPQRNNVINTKLWSKNNVIIKKMGSVGMER